jgi:hypothetical protein
MIHRVVVEQLHFLNLSRKNIDRPPMIDQRQFDQVLSAAALSLSDSAWASLNAFLKQISLQLFDPRICCFHAEIIFLSVIIYLSREGDKIASNLINLPASQRLLLSRPVASGTGF